MVYPGGERTGKEISYQTGDNFETVLSYFDRTLAVKPIGIADTGDWRKEKMDQETYLYSCYSADINLLTVETGCIYVVSHGQVTDIRSWLLTGEGSNTPCSEP